MWWWPKKSKVENFYEAEIPCTGFCLSVPLLSQSFDRYFLLQYRALLIFSKISARALKRALNVFFSSLQQSFQRRYRCLLPPPFLIDQQLHLICFLTVQYLPPLPLPGRQSCCYLSLLSHQFPCRSLHISYVPLSIC